jgi:hypothetical protein
MKRSQSKQGSKWRAERALVASAVVTLLAWGCSGDEELRAVGLGGGCSINSDCKDLLVCAFGYCHEQCTKDRDCELGLRCMNSPLDESLGVCQLESEVDCETDRDCPGLTQVCGIDDECRDPCEDDGDCTTTQVCANSNECASTDAEYDVLDGDGNIVTQGGSGASGGSGGHGGSSGSSGKGGASGQGGSGNTAGTDAGQGGESAGGAGGGPLDSGGMGGVPGGEAGESGTGASSGGVPASGGTGAGGSAGDGGSGEGGSPTPDEGGAAGMTGEGGASDGGPLILVEPIGEETLDNDSRETALETPVPSRATIYVNDIADQDWFKITPPNNGLSHIVWYEIEQEVGASTVVYATLAADNSAIDSLSYANGVTSAGYVTVGPGATLLLIFVRRNGTITSALAHLRFQMMAENDAHEPNNTKETATVIQRDSVTSGIVSMPWVSATNRPVQDWFAVDLDVGSTTVGFTAVPSTGRILVSRVAPNGATTSIGSNASGATGDFPAFTVTQAGTYYFVFEPSSGITNMSVTLPPYLSQPYSFRVTQQ